MIEKTFSPEVRGKIEEAIREAESGTSGEIRVHVEEYCKEEVLDHAAFIFEKLEMHKTAQRNGVLIYVSLMDRRLAIIGDAGFNQLTEQNFWHEATDAMKVHLAAGKIEEGIKEGIRLAGVKMKRYFPIEVNDQNEITNAMSIGKRKKKFPFLNNK